MRYFFVKNLNYVALVALGLFFIACEEESEQPNDLAGMTLRSEPILIDDANLTNCLASNLCSSNVGMNKVAVIVEPRILPSLLPVVRNAIDKLPADWIVQVFHSPQNEQLIMEGFSDEISRGKVLLSKMHVEGMTVYDYNFWILMNPNFWMKVVGETILNFEADTVLCSGASYNIEDFLEFDYVGAPWKNGNQCFVSEHSKFPGKRVVSSERETDLRALEISGHKNIKELNFKIGNSGLALLKRGAILKVLRDYVVESDFMKTRAADFVFSCGLSNNVLEGPGSTRLPPLEMAQAFSVEGIYVEGLRPIGIHKPWANLALSDSELRSLGQSCPELNTILKPAFGF